MEHREHERVNFLDTGSDNDLAFVGRNGRAEFDARNRSASSVQIILRKLLIAKQSISFIAIIRNPNL